ncbi:fatty acid desaturase, partial [Saccharothrix algeriensis]
VLNEYWSVRTRRDKRAFLVFWAAVAGVVTTTGTVAEFVLFWLVPYLTAFQIIGWYIELSEHTPAVKFTNVDLYMTRNRKSRGLERFLTGTYADHHHLDHHLDPRTPYWNLEAAHRIRLADPRYAEVDRSFGGLFTRGPQAQPSALSDIVRRLAEYHSAKRSTGSAAVREAV